MAVSKRLRFEILRRDDFTCRYCGRKPPETELRIDHVLPKALGGTDDPGNLVSSCHDCNSGKTSIAPGSPLVAQVDADAIRWSAAIQHAAAKALEDVQGAHNYREGFYKAWNEYQRPAPLDENWRSSVETFRTRGLPLVVLIDSAHQAMGRRSVAAFAKFAYTCGIAWNRLRDMEKDARAHLGVTAAAGETAAAPDDVLIDALTLLWRANWLSNGKGEPGAALLAEARESATAALEENDDIEALVRGVISASWSESADIKKDVYDEPTKEEWAVLSFYKGWLQQEQRPQGMPPEDCLIELAAWVAAAASVEYEDDAIAQAAYWAGRRGDLSTYPAYFRDIASAIGDTSDPLWGPNFLEAGSRYRVDDETAAELWESAEREHEILRAIRAEREARKGGDMPNRGV